MAKAPAHDINESARQAARGFVSILTWVIPIVLLLAALVYFFMGGGTPRAKLKTVDATFAAYTQLVSIYRGPTGGLPSNPALDEFLSYFDGDSRRFFEENAPAMARTRMQFDIDQFKGMTEDQLRIQAMLYLVNRPPLSGLGAIQGKRQLSPTRVEADITGFDGKQHKIFVEETAGLWYIMQLGGLRDVLDKELDPIRKQLDRERNKD